ncbi:hypothetical protein CHH28_14600 [Bacterioplanes sanyensis]|uniref:Type VI secretion protein n=1 Tax=Bacterioplanes sanyensis TaxID=1249553 RepID=A0A222FLC3_9GAMM|nr:hypothetical protein [Bacterioplanes sanyensis]ASP39827.1 hypothetical protein CHH28_14600 [Bacterioplanes sanyensis]
MNRTQPIRTALLLLITAVTLVACSSNDVKPPANELTRIDLEASADSNRNVATALDLVFINDDQVATLLAELNGPQWFERKTELTMRYASAITVVSFEVVPLTLSNNVALPTDHSDAKRILLFANYLGSQGQYVSELSQFHHLKIRLLRDRYALIDVATVAREQD